jgi:quercetin dioxygenase-like cupin family protein
MINELVTVAGNEPLRPIRNGVWKRVITASPALNVDEIFFDAGIATDAHGHDVEQAAYQVTGRFEIDLNGRVVTLGPGDGYAIPAGTPHSVKCVEKGSYLLITANPGGAAGGHSHGDDQGHEHGHDHGHNH